MPEHYKLLIIGTGAAASTVAARVSAAGWRVAVIDFLPFGGTCALRGCDPKKVLFGVAAATAQAESLYDKGLAGSIAIDWPALLAFKRSFTQPVPSASEQNFREKGIDTYHGCARFTGHNTLTVDGVELQGDYILIASGAEPRKLGIPGEQYLIANEKFLELESLPHRIVMVGGGYIASEFSHIAAQAGAQVTILQHGERLLNPFDPDLVDLLLKSFRLKNIDVRTNTTVEEVESSNGGFLVSAVSAGQKITVEADLVVHAAGRVPALTALDPGVAGIEVENGKLKLNDYLQSTSNPAVYAAGDAAQKGPPLTPVAGYDAEIVAANLLEGNHRTPDYSNIPSVVFTIPPLAAVGLGEEQARNHGRKFRVSSSVASEWFTARQNAEPSYGYKILIEEDTDRVIGAHLIGPHAEDAINVFTLAMRYGITASELKATIFAYPTSSWDIRYML